MNNVMSQIHTIPHLLRLSKNNYYPSTILKVFLAVCNQLTPESFQELLDSGFNINILNNNLQKLPNAIFKLTAPTLQFALEHGGLELNKLNSLNNYWFSNDDTYQCYRITTELDLKKFQLLLNHNYQPPCLSQANEYATEIFHKMSLKRLESTLKTPLLKQDNSPPQTIINAFNILSEEQKNIIFDHFPSYQHVNYRDEL